eukprot:CAMPEP_0183311546 /NCGR_PEP_ID=MMETSP0160_2-20130417/37549_1 /TAXON_ID=2839 ORGANISM="Odontella Sinensis, Strain Grunow 1884" /NCGR_SAMPLE_ID=MMETSP0160_2 /ASSEMBLY_ACC=CAM_ASM_000250 /LENGTH=71 /DNA_ID=CAMNT_0025476161 /DNA_START=62 /DNA_END=274 /DNA_ORIENTATION=+
MTTDTTETVEGIGAMGRGIGRGTEGATIMTMGMATSGTAMMETDTKITTDGGVRGQKQWGKGSGIPPFGER